MGSGAAPVVAELAKQAGVRGRGRDRVRVKVRVGVKGRTVPLLPIPWYSYSVGTTVL